MHKKTPLQIIFVVIALGLIAIFTICSSYICDDDELRFPVSEFFLVFSFIQLILPILSASSVGIFEFKLLQPNSTALYLELHEKSPPLNFYPFLYS